MSWHPSYVLAALAAIDLLALLLLAVARAERSTATPAARRAATRPPRAAATTRSTAQQPAPTPPTAADLEKLIHEVEALEEASRPGRMRAEERLARDVSRWRAGGGGLPHAAETSRAMPRPGARGNVA